MTDRSGRSDLVACPSDAAWHLFVLIALVVVVIVIVIVQPAPVVGSACGVILVGAAEAHRRFKR
ncbi:hypothetical protein GCM10010331_70840 [Streptomyces xanthochromogenes]|uniref:hypothetical protein n=1 Tax=Streptomyces xanthochromogenes TaxID=67384 RepID=UPI0016757E02|nr:hypothetical protein [Streptomyces xanthochromogenes]GHB72519.1 hypothetical protein GCM10010331_70840 [Streptomyces xanthochromogenes]